MSVIYLSQCTRPVAARARAEPAMSGDRIPLFAGTNRDRSGSESSRSQRQTMLNEKMNKFLSVRGRHLSGMSMRCNYAEI